MSIWKKSTYNLELGDVPANENFINLVGKPSLLQGHIKNMVVLFDMVPIKLLYAYAEATVPKITVITRKVSFVFYITGV